MEQSFLDQSLHKRQDAADLNQFCHQMFAARLEIGQDWHALSDSSPVVELQFNASGVGHCYQVQDRVSRAAKRNHDSHRVLERFFRKNVGWTNATFD